MRYIYSSHYTPLRCKSNACTASAGSAKSLILLVHSYKGSCRQVTAEQMRADVGEFTTGDAHGEAGLRTIEAAEHLLILLIAYWGLAICASRKRILTTLSLH